MRITPVNQNNYKNNNQNKQEFGAMTVKCADDASEALLRRMVPDLDMKLGLVSDVTDRVLKDIKVVAKKVTFDTLELSSRGEKVYFSYNVGKNTVAGSRETRVTDMFLPALDRLKLLVDGKIASDNVRNDVAFLKSKK